MSYKRREKDMEVIQEADLSIDELRLWIGDLFYGDKTLGFHFPHDAFVLWVDEVIRRYEEVLDKKRRGMILQKILHTKEVVDAGLSIMSNSGEVDWDQSFVCTVCLLHDIGRFEQALLGSYSDKDTDYDHALEGSRLVDGADLEEMEMMGIQKKLLVDAINEHSRLSYEGDNVYAKLIRDADKLALLRYMPYLIDNSRYQKGIVTEEAKSSYQEGRMIEHKYMIGYADVLLAWLCWEGDFNFVSTSESFENEGLKEWILSELRAEGVVL